MQVRDSNFHIIQEFATGSGSMTLGATGLITVTLDAGSMELLPCGLYNYDLVLNDGTTIQNVFFGSFQLLPGPFLKWGYAAVP